MQNISLAVTERNQNIIDTFISGIQAYITSSLLSGSNAWGRGYALTSNSDIDLLFVTKDTTSIKQIIKIWHSRQLVTLQERDRSIVFEKLYNTNIANTFSVKTNYKNVDVSIDFMLEKEVSIITGLKPLYGVKVATDSEIVRLRTLREFRTNQPKNDGYTVDDLTSQQKLIYHPKFTELKSNGHILGYIADTLVDGISDNSYFMGVYSFFLCVEPNILTDRNKFLESHVIKLQKNVSKQLTKPVVNITRQERMSFEVLERIKSKFNELQ